MWAKEELQKGFLCLFSFPRFTIISLSFTQLSLHLCFKHLITFLCTCISIICCIDVARGIGCTIEVGDTWIEGDLGTVSGSEI